MGGGAPIKRLDYGAPGGQEGTPPPVGGQVDDGLGGLYAGGAFRQLHYPAWRVTIRFVKNIVDFLDLLQKTAEQGVGIEKQIADIDKMLIDRRAALEVQITPEYYQIVNGTLVITPKGLAALANDPIYSRLPKDDQALSQLGILQMIVGVEIDKRMQAEAARMYQTKVVLSASLKSIKQKAFESASNILSGEKDISSKIASISIDRTDEKLASANISFFDPAGGFFDSIGQWDLLDIQLGWADGADSPRYKLGPAFNGVITNKNTTGSAGSSGSSVITAMDMGIFTNLTEVKMSYGNDNTNTAQFFADMFKKAGLSNDVSKMPPLETGKNLIYKQTVAQYIQGRCDVDGTKISPIMDGVGLFQSFPKDFRDKSFVYQWFDNIISYDLSEEWPLEDEKPGKSGGDSDDEDVAPPTEAPDDTLPTEAGKDPGPLGSLKARLKKFRESKEKNMGAKVLQGSIIIRGEPRMTNESLIFITGLSPGKNGIYRVISCQTVTSPTFTTSLQVQYVNVPPVKPDIGALSAAHDLATGGEPDVIKDNEVEPPNTATGPGIAGNTSLEGRPEIPRVR